MTDGKENRTQSETHNTAISARSRPKQNFIGFRGTSRDIDFITRSVHRQVKCNAIYIFRQCIRPENNTGFFPTRSVFRKGYTRPSRILEFSMVVPREGWANHARTVHRGATSRVIHRGTHRVARKVRAGTRRCTFNIRIARSFQNRYSLVALCFINPPLCKWSV